MFVECVAVFFWSVCRASAPHIQSAPMAPYWNYGAHSYTHALKLLGPHWISWSNLKWNLFVAGVDSINHRFFFDAQQIIEIKCAFHAYIAFHAVFLWCMPTGPTSNIILFFLIVFCIPPIFHCPIHAFLDISQLHATNRWVFGTFLSFLPLFYFA